VTHLILEQPYYGWLGILLKKFTGVKLVIHSMNIETTRWKSLGKWWWKIMFYYEKTAHRCSDYNLFIHEDDRQYAITKFGLRPSTCAITTYGIEWSVAPSDEECRSLQQQIKQQYGIAAEEHVLLFNGAFNYAPNLDALKNIIDIVDPLLQQKKGFRYKIIVCGMNIPEAISSASYTNIIIAGFAEDVSRYFKASDVLLNPVIDGGGIKTKMVEALGYNRNVVSTVSGAIGVEPQWCNGKLLVVENDQWQAFADAVTVATGIKSAIPPVFFEHFSWEDIARQTVAFMEGAPAPQL
jgi:glycosyltransferase involved in cell wall biosynthesis